MACITVQLAWSNITGDDEICFPVRWITLGVRSECSNGLRPPSHPVPCTFWNDGMLLHDSCSSQDNPWRNALSRRSDFWSLRHTSEQASKQVLFARFLSRTKRGNWHVAVRGKRLFDEPVFANTHFSLISHWSMGFLVGMRLDVDTYFLQWILSLVLYSSVLSLVIRRKNTTIGWCWSTWLKTIEVTEAWNWMADSSF